jgi:hypothetical protein
MEPKKTGAEYLRDATPVQRCGRCGHAMFRDHEIYRGYCDGCIKKPPAPKEPDGEA